MDRTDVIVIGGTQWPGVRVRAGSRGPPEWSGRGKRVQRSLMGDESAHALYAANLTTIDAVGSGAAVHLQRPRGGLTMHTFGVYLLTAERHNNPVKWDSPPLAIMALCSIFILASASENPQSVSEILSRNNNGNNR
jgi:hypothetical protein